MKRFTRIVFCVIAIIIISILFCQIACYAEQPKESQDFKIKCQQVVVTQYKTKTAEKFLWETLSSMIDNEKIVAGIMGYFKRESELRSDAVAGWPVRDKRSGTNFSMEFTQKVDEGLEDGSTKDYFIEQVNIHFGGYGLGQWLSENFLNKLYDFAQEYGTSIGDAEMQCAFVIWSMEHQTPKLWEEIQNEKDIWIIGRKIGHYYDGTGELGSSTIASHANEYYKKYATD